MDDNKISEAPELQAIAQNTDIMVNMLNDMLTEMRALVSKLNTPPPQAARPTNQYKKQGSYNKGGGGGGYKKKATPSEEFTVEVINVEDFGNRARIQISEGNKWLSTFDRAIIDMAIEALDQGFPLSITTVQSGQYTNIHSAEPAF